MESKVMSGGETPAPVDGDLFDDIMNQYVDRSAFARHHRSSGDVNAKHRKSKMKGNHLGTDQFEDEVARRKRLTAFIDKDDLPDEGSLAEVSSIGSGSLQQEVRNLRAITMLCCQLRHRF